MQHILVPTDFSESAENALNYALKLAKKSGASITIYHACQIPASSRYRPSPSIIEQEKKTVIHETRRKLKLICEKARDTGTVCFTQSTVSPVSEGIIDVARQTGAGMIIMGTRGENGIPNLLLGTVTLGVIQSSPIPVLAIPKSTSYQPIEKIVFPTDYNDSDFLFLKKLVLLASGFESELSILHIHSLEGDFQSDALFESYREKVRSTFEYDRISFHLIEKTNILEAISNFSINYGASIISMAASRKDLFDSVFRKNITREMASISKMPLLAFRS